MWYVKPLLALTQTYDIAQHNFKTGAKFKRNPSFTEFDFITLCKTAVFCKGLLPDSPQLEFIYALLSKQPLEVSIQQHFRPGGESVPVGKPWERLFSLLPLRTNALEAVILRKRSQPTDIKKLMQSAHVTRRSIPSDAFVKQLGLNPEYESTADFTADEFVVLEQTRGEQLALDGKIYKWRECPVVATVMYNAAVNELTNPCLKLKKR